MCKKVIIYKSDFYVSVDVVVVNVIGGRAAK